MHDLVSWLKKVMQENTLHSLEIASIFHYKFIRIHPFSDGNGRTARMLSNIILMHYGYPIIVVPSDAKDKDAYYTALNQTDTLIPDLQQAIQEPNNIKNYRFIIEYF